MPSETDRYFAVEDNAREVRHLANAKLKPIPSIFGHLAGSQFGPPDDAAYVAKGVSDLLSS